MTNPGTGFELVRIDPSSLSPRAVIRVRIERNGPTECRLFKNTASDPHTGPDLVLTWDDAEHLTGILRTVLDAMVRGRRAQRLPRRPWNKFEDGPQDDRARPDGIPDACD